MNLGSEVRFLFNIGDIIVYGTQGICEINRVETKKVGKFSSDYYVLKPLYNENTAVFVPVDNEKLTARIQSVLSVEQAQNLIALLPHIKTLDISDESERRNEYREVLASNDRQRLAAVIKTLKKERALRRNNGKKLNLNDEQILNKAELLLYNELGFVLKIEPGEVADKFLF